MSKGFIILIILITSGCCSLCEKEPEFKPLPPEKLHDLLHIGNNYAYKSVTKEDYDIEDFCSTEG
jgi:hypothetical protein